MLCTFLDILSATWHTACDTLGERQSAHTNKSLRGHKMTNAVNITADAATESSSTFTTDLNWKRTMRIRRGNRLRPRLHRLQLPADRRRLLRLRNGQRRLIGSDPTGHDPTRSARRSREGDDPRSPRAMRRQPHAHLRAPRRQSRHAAGQAQGVRGSVEGGQGIPQPMTRIGRGAASGSMSKSSSSVSSPWRKVALPFPSGASTPGASINW